MIYKLLFTDRFNRKFCGNFKFITLAIGYFQETHSVLFNRNKLPSSFCFDGAIFWRNANRIWHCSTGPSTIKINGEMVYEINGNAISKMEWLLAIEK